MVGDSWSLLIVRDLMFKGLRTFREFSLSDEGIASNVLADRLARLERAGILAKAPDPSDRRRLLYRLTAKGIDLAPVLIEVVLWTARHENTAAPEATVREMRNRRTRFLRQIRQRWRSTQAVAKVSKTGSAARP